MTRVGRCAGDRQPRLFHRRDRRAGLGADGALGHAPRSRAAGSIPGAALLYLCGMALAIIGGPVVGAAGAGPATRWRRRRPSSASTPMCWTMSTGRTWARSQSIADGLCGAPGRSGRCSGSGCTAIWAPAPFLLAGGFRAGAAGDVLDPAAGQRQADHPGQGAGGEPARLSGPVLRQPRLIAGWLFAVIAVLRLVGLCRLPADLLHRGGAGRQGGRHRAVDHQRAAVRRAVAAEPLVHAAVGAARGPGRLLWGAVLFTLRRGCCRPALVDGGADASWRRSSW